MIETALTAGLIAGIIVAVVCRICWRRAERCNAEGTASKLEVQIGDDIKLSWTRSKKVSEAPQPKDTQNCAALPTEVYYTLPQRIENNIDLSACQMQYTPDLHYLNRNSVLYDSLTNQCMNEQSAIRSAMPESVCNIKDAMAAKVMSEIPIEMFTHLTNAVTSTENKGK